MFASCSKSDLLLGLLDYVYCNLSCWLFRVNKIILFLLLSCRRPLVRGLDARRGAGAHLAGHGRRSVDEQQQNRASSSSGAGQCLQAVGGHCER